MKESIARRMTNRELKEYNCNFINQTVILEYNIYTHGRREFHTCYSNDDCQLKKFGRIIGKVPKECEIYPVFFKY